MATRPTRSAPARSAAPARRSASRGSSVIDRAREVHERQDELAAQRRDQAGIPFRYFLSPGDSEQIVILDDEPIFARHEHNLKNPQSGKWDLYTSCIAEHDNCPVCRVAERPSYFGMYFTILDLKPYVTHDNEEVEWSKKLLVAKPTQQKKLIRLYERHGTMRGMILQMTRDSDKDAAIGNDIEFVDFMPEDELLTYEREYVDRQNKTQVIIGHEPVNYEEVFPEQNEEQLRAIVGGSPLPGSRADDGRGSSRGRAPSRAPSRDGWDEDRPAARSRPARGRVEEQEDADQDDAPPARRAPSRAAPARSAPTRTAPTRRAPSRADEDPDDNDDGQQDTPPPRSSAPSQRRPAPRRATPVQEDQDGGEEDAPADNARRPASMASRRAALRRS